MEKTFLVFLLSILAFFFSSIPFGYVIAKLKGIDIRKYGSGNIGATNVTRVLGKKYGALVLFLDAIKGTIFVILGKFFSLNLFELTIIALFAILGHMFSPFLKGKGGKGIATALGTFIVISPITTLFAILDFILVFLLTKIVSLSSLSAALLFLAAFPVIERRSTYVKEAFFIVLIIVALIFYKHKDNIKRLLKGKEYKFGQK